VNDTKVHVLKEVTGTVGGFRYPENVYYVRGDRLVAYYPEGRQDEFVIYDKPMRFSKSGRKFETLAKTNGL
jgi:hypothetical protein